MFKWFLLLLLIFIGLWIYFKRDFPVEVVNNQAGYLINALTHPLDEIVANYDDSFLRKDHKTDMIDVSSDQLKTLIQKVNTSSKYVVFFFFSADCFSCRTALSSINNVIPKLKSKVQFFLIHIGEDKEPYNVLLNQLPKINFKLFNMTEQQLLSNKVTFINKGVNFEEVPVALMTRRSAIDFEKLTVGFFTTARIENIVEQRL